MGQMKLIADQAIILPLAQKASPHTQVYIKMFSFCDKLPQQGIFVVSVEGGMMLGYEHVEQYAVHKMCLEPA